MEIVACRSTSIMLAVVGSVELSLPQPQPKTTHFGLFIFIYMQSIFRKLFDGKVQKQEKLVI